MVEALRAARWLCLAALLLAHSARADSAWLVVRGDAACGGGSEALAARIDAAIAGARDPSARAEVQLEGRTAVMASVQLRVGSRALGSKTLELRSCDEALDAVAAVLALALSSLPDPPAAAPQAVLTTSGAPAVPVARTQHARAAQAQRLDQHASRDPAQARGVRLLAALGVDLGTLTQPTLLVAGGSALALGRAELRAIGRYGVPSTVEEQTGELERLRADFGAAALDACWGLDRARWLSACGGVELSLIRSVHTRETPAGEGSQAKRLEAAFGPLAGLSLVLRSVPGQPQLELSAQLPLAGRAPAPGFRAALGGGVLF